MGASQSIDQQTSSRHLVSLYHREFERDEVEPRKPQQIDREGLYLDDYGDEPDVPAPESETTPVEPETVDDDYPIDKLNANISDTKPVHDEEPETSQETSSVPLDIRQSFETARDAKQVELDIMYPKLPERTPPCGEARDSLLQCYRDNADILNCREAVDVYSRCAKSFSENLLVNK